MLASFPDLQPGLYAMAFAVVFLAAIIQSSTGMGFGQVAGPLLLLINADFVPVPIIIMGMVVATLNAIKGHRQVVLKELGVALSGRIIGSIVAAWLLFHIANTESFSLVFAGLILLTIALGFGK